MKKSHIYLVSLFMLSLFAIPSQAFAFFGMDLGVGYWQQGPSGAFSYKSAAPLDQLDLESDLHFDKQNKPFVRAKVELPLVLPNIYFMLTPMVFEGSGNISRTNITYGGQTFSGTAPFESKLKLDHYDLALFYPIPLLKTATLGKLNVELGLNIRNIVFEGTLAQPTVPLTEPTDNISLYVPMIYAGVQVMPVDAFSVEFEIRGVAYSGSSYYDYLGRLKFNPIPLVYIAGGYRAETIKIDEEDVLADIKFGGPFLEVGLSF